METPKITDTCTYQIIVSGWIDAQDLNAMSPLAIEAVQAVETAAAAGPATAFSLRADQSGLIGLLRHLHARRLVFLSVEIGSTTESRGK